jgi:predicted glycosyltransferase
MLGIPSIYLFNDSTLYTTHLEKDYKLLFNYSESQEDQAKAIDKAIKLLQTDNTKKEWAKKTNKMLSEKIDVTAFLVWFVENYPVSAGIMKMNPDYQYKFR